MRKEVKTKVKAGDVIGVKEKHHTFIGKGYRVESVVVLKVINEFDDNEKEGGDHYPLFTVKVDQEILESILVAVIFIFIYLLIEYK